MGPPPPKQRPRRGDRGELGASSDTLSGLSHTLSGVQIPYDPPFSTLTWPSGGF